MTDTAEILLQNLSHSERNALIGTAQTIFARQLDGAGTATITGTVNLISIAHNGDEDEPSVDVSLVIEGASPFSSEDMGADFFLVR